MIQERERAAARTAEEAEGEGLTPKCRVGTEQSAVGGNGRTKIKKEKASERGEERKKENPGFLANAEKLGERAKSSSGSKTRIWQSIINQTLARSPTLSLSLSLPLSSQGPSQLG